MVENDKLYSIYNLNYYLYKYNIESVRYKALLLRYSWSWLAVLDLGTCKEGGGEAKVRYYKRYKTLSITSIYIT